MFQKKKKETYWGNYEKSNRTKSRDEWARPGRHSLPKVVGPDRGGGDGSAQRTLQAARTSMEVFLWKLESKNQRLCSRNGSHGVNQVCQECHPEMSMRSRLTVCSLDGSWCLSLKSSIRGQFLFLPVLPHSLGAVKLQGWGLILWLLPSYSLISYQCFSLAKPNHKPADKEAWER